MEIVDEEREARKERARLKQKSLVAMEVDPENDTKEAVDRDKETRLLKATQLQIESRNMEGIQEVWEKTYVEGMDVDEARMPPPNPKKKETGKEIAERKLRVSWVMDTGNGGVNPHIPKQIEKMDLEEEKEEFTIHLGKRKRNGKRKYVLKEVKNRRKKTSSDDRKPKEEPSEKKEKEENLTAVMVRIREIEEKVKEDRKEKERKEKLEIRRKVRANRKKEDTKARNQMSNWLTKKTAPEGDKIPSKMKEYEKVETKIRKINEGTKEGRKGKTEAKKVKKTSSKDEEMAGKNVGLVGSLVDKFQPNQEKEKRREEIEERKRRVTEKERKWEEKLCEERKREKLQDEVTSDGLGRVGNEKGGSFAPRGGLNYQFMGKNSEIDCSTKEH